MIRFKMGEMPELIGGFHGKLAKEKRYKPPGRWRPFINVNTVVLQDEDTDKWVAWLEWELMGGKGAYPCRDTGKNESISRTDPPDMWPHEIAAQTFARECRSAFIAQYKKWITSSFSGGSDELP